MTFGDTVRAMCRWGGDPPPNTDPETGIAYGVSGPSETPDWAWEEAEPVYFFGCGGCGTEFDDDVDVDDPAFRCPYCGHREKYRDEWYGEEPLYHRIQSADVDAESDSDGVNWTIVRSNRIVLARECSPCYPCAGDLGSIGDDGYPTYGWPKEDESTAMLLPWTLEHIGAARVWHPGPGARVYISAQQLRKMKEGS